jgi:hypothetical protein
MHPPLGGIKAAGGAITPRERQDTGNVVSPPVFSPAMVNGDFTNFDYIRKPWERG